MARGFTFIELIISVTVLTILLGAIAPNVSTLINEHKIKRVAGDLQAFIQYAKYEAVMRNKNLVITLADPLEASWQIHLTDEDPDENQANPGSTEIISSLEGLSYAGVNLSHNYSDDKISLDGRKGRITDNGSLYVSLKNDANLRLRLKLSHQANRAIMCAEKRMDNNEYHGVAQYGYPGC